MSTGTGGNIRRYRDPNVDAEIQAIERALDHAAWRSVRPLFLAMVLVLVSLWGAMALSATVNLTCTPPTHNVDNSQITAVLAYKAYWGTSAASLGTSVTLAGPGCKGPVSVPDPIAGQSVQYHFAVTAIANGQESAKSNVLTKTLTTPFPTPNPPTLLTAETVGYQQNLGARNKISLSRVASVPLGKPCTTTSLTDPFRTVHIIADRMLAIMDPDPKRPGMFYTRPRQVWARCEAS